MRWTDSAYAAFGLDPRHAVPIPTASLHSFVIGADRAPVRRFRQSLLHRREPAVAVFRIVRPGDTAIRQIRIFAEPVLAGDEVVALRGAFQDVSAHYHTQVALAATQDQLADSEQRAEQEQQLALRLQRAIMPEDEPPVEAAGVEVAVRYRPAEQGRLVAGDWYDALLLPDKQLLIVVGDITGHGIDAVTGMIAARNALRGLAATGAGPADLLRHLNYASCHLTEGIAGTVVCGRYDPETRVLRWARAGHLPPVLVRDGAAEMLPLPGGVLLGLDPDAEYEEATLAMRGGDTLLLFTDGLIERRADSISDALREFTAAAVPAGDDASAHADRILDNAHLRHRRRRLPGRRPDPVTRAGPWTADAPERAKALSVRKHRVPGHPCAAWHPVLAPARRCPPAPRWSSRQRRPRRVGGRVASTRPGDPARLPRGPATPGKPGKRLLRAQSPEMPNRTSGAQAESLRAREPQADRWRRKNRSELSVSNPGTSPWRPGLACSVFSAEPMASNRASPQSRGTISSSHCRWNSTGTVTRAAASASVSWPISPRTAAVIRGSAATSGRPIAVPSDTPQYPTGPEPIQSSAGERVDDGLPLGYARAPPRPRRAGRTRHPAACPPRSAPRSRRCTARRPPGPACRPTRARRWPPPRSRTASRSGGRGRPAAVTSCARRPRDRAALAAAAPRRPAATHTAPGTSPSVNRRSVTPSEVVSALNRMTAAFRAVRFAVSHGLLPGPAAARNAARTTPAAGEDVPRPGACYTAWPSSQVSMLRARVGIGSEPWSRTAAWKAGSENAGPSRRLASSRSRSISSLPVR